MGSGSPFNYRMLRNLFIFFAFIHFARASDLLFDPTDSLFDDYFDSCLCEDGARFFELSTTLPDSLEIWQEEHDFESMTSKSLSDEISSEGSLPQALKPRASFDSRHSHDHKSILAKLKQSFNLQCPNEKFNLRQYDVINWPEDVNLHEKKEWTSRDIEKIESRLGDILFKKREQKISRYVQYNAADLEEHADTRDVSISYEKAHSIIKQRFQEETGCKSKIQWHLLDKSALPSKYAEIAFNNQSFLLVGLHRNREILDNIHFKRSRSALSKDGSEVIVEPISRTNLKAKLKDAFKLQHPSEPFFLGDNYFEVQNWPEDVDISKTKWTSSEKAKIVERIPHLVFIKRVTSTTEGLGDRYMSNILRSGWSQEDIHELLQESGRLETDYPAAKSIDWTESDHVRIPRNYDPFQTNYIFNIQEGSKKRQSEQIDEALKKSRLN